MKKQLFANPNMIEYNYYLSCLIRVLRIIHIAHSLRILRNTLSFNDLLNTQGLSNHT